MLVDAERVVLITGCSSGIGLAAAAAFASGGWHVVATMRDLARSAPLRDALAAAAGDAGDAGGVDIRQLDVVDQASVQSAVAGILADFGRIDAVVNNAGVGCDGTLEELSIDDIRAVMDVNFFGTVRVFQAALPSMRERRAGRLIAVGSIGGVLGQPFNDAYCASKFAVEGMLESLQPVVAPFGVHVSVIEPGPVAGEFVQHAAIAGFGRQDGGPYSQARAKFQIVQDGGYEHAETPEQVAAVILEVANSPSPLLRYQTSAGISRFAGIKVKDLTGERVTGLTSAWIT
jgi:NAD(P)-dependent dehydrogenase (short-subunit alcohol dehydrogenase family)